MELSNITKKKIFGILNCIEMGTPNLDYSSITLLPDGPDDIIQVTLSFGATEYGGNLKKVLEKYIEKNGPKTKKIAPYINRIGLRPSLSKDKTFLKLLKDCGVDTQMQEAQDEVYEEVYFRPALQWAEKEKFTLPLSVLVIFDSILQSGQIFKFLRNRFAEATPKNGGDEKKWITAYLNARHNWLSTHSNKAIRNSSYRTKTYLNWLKADNWQLSGDLRTTHGCDIV